MKTKILQCFFIVFCSLCTHNVRGQNPNWAVNASNYQYSMTFTAFLNVDGTTLTLANDKVAAFVGEEIRGVANVVYVESANKHVVYLSVYANTANETVSFKIYNSTADTVVNSDKTIPFSIDGNAGGIRQSFSIASPALNENAVFNSFNFLGITAVVEEISSNKINIVLPENTPISSLTPVYTTSTNSNVFVDEILQTSKSSVHNFTNSIIYKVVSEDESTIKEYEVMVVVALNSDPTTVSISTSESLNTNSNPVVLEVAFSKIVSGFDISDFILENAALTSFSTTDSQNYKVEIIPFSQGLFSVQIPANVSLDVNNNQNEISNKLALTYDISKPVISSISVDSNAGSWWFLVSFNEDVLHVDITDFELKGMASSGVVIAGITNVSKNQYSVNIANTNTAIGVISLQVKKDSDIKDIAGNFIALSEFEAYFLNHNVLKKPITITADAQTKVYGEADPELTYQVTSGILEAGDVLSGNLTRTVGEAIGDYVISSTLANENYEITFISNNLSITKREITITADAKIKVQNDIDPELTYQITQGNLIDGDAFSGNLVREAGETEGVYLIQIGSLTLSSNYILTFIEANFEISATASINDVILVNQLKLYPNPTKSFLNIETSNQLNIKEIVIYTLLGKIIRVEKLTHNRVQLKDLTSGTYLIKIITNQGITIKRIVKN